MRISTSQYYETSAANYSRTYGNVVASGEEASSGIKVNTAADDPVGAARLLQLGQQSSMLTQYKSNMTAATTTMTASETALTSITNALQRARELALSASNATYTDADRQANAEELSQIQSQVLGLMNSQDASGNYLFSGSKSSTPPYTVNADGSYSYNGDQTSTNVAIGQGLSIATNTTGWDAFEQATNTTRTSTTPSVSDGKVTLSGGIVSNSATYSSSFTSGAPYTISYTSATQLKITDNTGTDRTSELTANGVVSASTAADQTVSFRGVDLTLNVNLATGDDASTVLTGRSFTFAATPDTFNTARVSTNTSTSQITSAITGASDSTASAATQAADAVAYTSKFPANGAVVKVTGTTPTTTVALYASPLTANSQPIDSQTLTGGSVTLAGVKFSISGTPATGDQFTVQSNTHTNQNILNTLNDLRTALMTPTDGDAVATQKLNAQLQSAIGNLASGSDQVSTALSSIGARGQAVDAQSTTNTTLTTNNDTNQSAIRNSDPAEVMTRLTLQQTMLSAAQLAFSRISQLGLFNKL
ncbi:MAG: flagellar hook-associated protein 3 [Janthinobacterium lividum]|uniref:flagellar hook-associated protein 3 n=1 Tax=Pseudomonas baltica TaxID=2762576 RepID=UPI00289FA0E7|nr:flagellar hook-associated protein 3 [Pseudomonas baltica]